MSYEELHSVYVVSYKAMLKANQHRSEISSGMEISKVNMLVCFQHDFIWNCKYLKLWCFLYPLPSWHTFIIFFKSVWLFSKKHLQLELHIAVFRKFELNQDFCQQPWCRYTYSLLTLSLEFWTLPNEFPNCGWLGHMLPFKSTWFWELLSSFMFEFFQLLKK